MICLTCGEPFDHRASSHQGPECDRCCEEKMSDTVNRDCEHGSLARVCLTCEQLEEIATLREQLAKVCAAGKDLRDTAFCDVMVVLDCPRGDCDCCTCDAVGTFDAALAAARKAVGE